ncbi:cytidylyltransferase domain-containing protein [Synechococcus sp. CC9605]|uniref:RraA family protein n=1 Tax=Synechococcus sp. (strain CC9605) TaxID=110662 RepID=UPI00005D5DDD|nr:demethylmenaquinone methyltransferase [Synechococcus sp. CC9605]ABB35984.1 Demethylmenaquinone methyltransferase-like [Synechococcus sp. CC9605]
MKKYAIFLPAKGNSERVASKNTRLLDGKPLFLHTLEKLLQLGDDYEVYLDSECPEIFKMASHLEGFKPLIRDPALATNATDGNKLFLNEVFSCNHQVIAQHLCTSPFIENNTIKNCFSKVGQMSQDGSCWDSSFLVRKEKFYMWKNDLPLYSIDSIPNSADIESTTVETMGLYVCSREAALDTERRIGRNPCLIEAKPLEAVDVNYEEDLEMAQLLAAGKREQERNLLRNLSSLLSSPIISDILDSLGLESQIIRGLNQKCRNNAKIFGPAKTMHLRRKSKEDRFDEVYDALKHYETLVPGDVICVQNDCQEFAYFGELNANLAIRSGAIGAVIGGMTRDQEAVCSLGLPVFAKGITCQDVKNRAVYSSMNNRICIDGVFISPGDMMFADNEGTICIPKKHFKTVLELAKESIRKEGEIISDIATGINVSALRAERGDF